MAWSARKGVAQRRSTILLKIFGFLLIGWWLIDFGFNQDSHSDFGENLDRNQIEFQVEKLSPEHKEILEAFLQNHPLENESAVQFSKIHREENAKFSFRKPPNMFGVGSLGEMGKPVTMPDVLPLEVQKIYDKGWKDNQFNQYLSDLISVNRSLPDYRTNYCQNIQSNYSQNLPATSVIIIFHNEAFSTLLRSVHSVLNRSPDHLITEIILVDDFSDMSECSTCHSQFMT